jgi:hypothetical protein
VQRHRHAARSMSKPFIVGVAALAAITFAPLAHAMPAGDICNTAKCD